MTGYTALAADELGATATPLDEAVEAVHALLAARLPVLLLGHSFGRSARSVRLQRGAHYAVGVDVVELLRTWNKRFGHWNFFALPKIAFVLGVAPPRDSAGRALALLDVYEKLLERPDVVGVCKAELQRMQYARGFPPEVADKPPTPPGVCVSAYNASECTCGQPLLGKGPAVA
jgi:hypothetical protein